jgi:hypothetical protein
MKLLLLSVFLLAIAGCNSTPLRIVPAMKMQNLIEQRLGSSSYYISRPKDMYIYEARGKEGQLGYGLDNIDSSQRYGNSYFVELERGNPIGNEIEKAHRIQFVQSTILGKQVVWKVYKTETNYFIAHAALKELRFTASGLSTEGLDSMIAFASTLTLR